MSFQILFGGEKLVPFKPYPWRTGPKRRRANLHNFEIKIGSHPNRCRRRSHFDACDAHDDPRGEPDFGAFDLCGERLFWKIDYYDKDLQFGSPDPADPAITRRILTIMLASDY